jgi:hypothetical protein
LDKIKYKNMKKNILTITLATLGLLAFCNVTLAATVVSLSPSSVSVNSGQSFNVSVSVNPQGVNNFVEKIELKYPADILQVNSFTLGNSWMALTQAGYDLTDNTNGVLLKSAGYPGGLSSATTFGTVSFSAKKAGKGTISIGGNSVAFEANSQSAISGSPVSVTITAPTVVAPKPTTTAPETSGTAQNPTPAPSTDDQPIVVAPTEQPIVEQITPTNASFMGTISGIMTLGTGSIAVGILVVVLILMIGFYVIRPLVKKRK